MRILCGPCLQWRERKGGRIDGEREGGKKRVGEKERKTGEDEGNDEVWRDRGTVCKVEGINKNKYKRTNKTRTLRLTH
jgi:hypothetical protein